ncbi:hypothetical protein, partial [Chitinophaga sp.]|uniref:hypothetical protein n=1 Tax=Chitinophaga sp. TaxID=1869181 RepID=UPI002B5A2BE8
YRTAARTSFFTCLIGLPAFFFFLFTVSITYIFCSKTGLDGRFWNCDQRERWASGVVEPFFVRQQHCLP